MQNLPLIDTKLEMLKRVPILERIDLPRLKMLADKFQFENAPNNHMVFDEGDMGKRLYIIVSGRVLVSKKDFYGQKEIAKLGPGDFFGEIALLKNVPRTARITTLSACQFLCLGAKEFIEMYAEFPPHIRDDIQLIIAKRLQEQESIMRNS